MFSVGMVSQICLCMLQLTKKDKISKSAHMTLFWQRKTPCMLPWKKRGVDGKGMVKVRKKLTQKQTLSVSLPKVSSRQQTALPSSSLPSAGRGGLQAVVLVQHPGPLGIEHRLRRWGIFLSTMYIPVTAEIITFSCWTPSKLHSDKDLDHQSQTITGWQHNFYCIKRINSFVEIRSNLINCLLLSYLCQILTNRTSTSTKPTNTSMKFYVPPLSTERNTVYLFSQLIFVPCTCCVSQQQQSQSSPLQPSPLEASCQASAWLQTSERCTALMCHGF